MGAEIQRLHRAVYGSPVVGGYVVSDGRGSRLIGAGEGVVEVGEG